MNDFSGKVAVITGGAGGFGKAFAKLGASMGMKLVLADVEAGALDQAKAELSACGAEILALTCDVSSGKSVQALAEAAIAHYGAVHLVFNNAGVGAGGLIWENSEADWQWVLGVNLWGVIHGIRSFVPLMLACAKQDPSYRGHIVNTASMAGLLNAPALGAYNVSKHAVVSISETLYQDLQLIDAPIGASVVCPFFVPTGIHRSARNRPDALQNTAEATPSQQASQAMLDKAVSSAKLSADQIAQRTFDAIREKRFYIYSHPDALQDVRTRMDDILAGRNPSDPYAAAPHVKDMLRAKL